MKHLLAILFCLPIVACQNGRYVGPQINVSAGFQGVSIGLSLAGAATGILEPPRGTLEQDGKTIRPLHPADAP